MKRGVNIITTIVFDGQTLASDSQVSFGDMAHPAPFQKIYTPREDEYWEVCGVRAIAFGIAGDAESVAYIRELLNAGIDHRTRLEHEDLVFSCIVIDENGHSYEWLTVANQNKNRQTNRIIPMLPPLAIGSGRDYAFAAMVIGKDAKTAVKTAIRLDNNSGGEIQIFNVPPKPATPSVRPPKPVVEEPKVETKPEEVKA